MNELTSSNIKFFKKKKHIFRKNDKNKEKFFASFAGKMEAKIKPFYTKMIRKKALSAVKISSDLKKFSVWAGDFWWIHPYICANTEEGRVY